MWYFEMCKITSRMLQIFSFKALFCKLLTEGACPLHKLFYSSSHFKLKIRYETLQMVLLMLLEAVNNFFSAVCSACVGAVVFVYSII